MNEGSQSVVVFIVIAVVVAAIAHISMNRYWIATLAAGLISSVAFVVIATIQDGYIDKFIGVALIVCNIIAFGIAMLVGLPFAVDRNRNKNAGK